MQTETGELLPLEIKCPVTCEASDVAWIKDKKFVDNREGNIYRFQLKLQMFMCKSKRGIMFIYSRNSHQIIYDDFSRVFM